MRILFFGRYDPSYSRNAVLLKGLRLNGMDVLECQISPSARFWPIRLVWRFLRTRGPFDVMLVAFPGQEVMLLARLLTRRPIVFDAFASHYGGYILDRKRYPVRSMHARWYHALDAWSCRMADIVLLDTQAHIDFFVHEFGVPHNAFRRVWIGADTTFAVRTEEKKHTDRPEILFWGTFIPLQGIEYIVDAASRVPEARFLLVGRGQTRSRIEAVIRERRLTNIELRPTASHRELSDMMSRSDLCLGIFGDTSKTQMVIPNKVYEALAAGMPVITADTPAVRELFTEEDLFMVPAGNGAALAHMIRTALQDPKRTSSIALHGHETFMRYASPGPIGKTVADIIQSVA